jgi:hypothetical protein
MSFAAADLTTASHFVRRIASHQHHALVRLSPRASMRGPRTASFPYEDRPDVPANIVLGEG